MKNVAVITDRKGHLIEKKNFTSRIKLENYVGSKYNMNSLFDWMIYNDADEKANGDGFVFYKRHEIVFDI